MLIMKKTIMKLLIWEETYWEGNQGLIHVEGEYEAFHVCLCWGRWEVLWPVILMLSPNGGEGRDQFCLPHHSSHHIRSPMTMPLFQSTAMCIHFQVILSSVRPGSMSSFVQHHIIMSGRLYPQACGHMYRHLLWPNIRRWKCMPFQE